MNERMTPFEVIFARPGLVNEHFPRIAAALAPAGAGPDRERFLLLGEVGELMAELVPDGGEGTTQIGLLTFHAFRRWQEGGSDRKIDDATLRELVRLPPIGEWRLQPPRPAGYLQLPRHRLWVPGSGGMPAEPVDGWFWVSGDPAVNALDLLLVLGMHEGRSGLTVIELSAGPLPPEGHWGDLEANETGVDFENVLPGGAQLHGMSTAGEVLKLVSRVFWRLQNDG